MRLPMEESHKQNCKICDEKFTSKLNLRPHMANCAKCYKISRWAEHLKRDSHLAHGEESHTTNSESGPANSESVPANLESLPAILESM